MAGGTDEQVLHVLLVFVGGSAPQLSMIYVAALTFQHVWYSNADLSVKLAALLCNLLPLKGEGSIHQDNIFSLLLAALSAATPHLCYVFVVFDHPGHLMWQNGMPLSLLHIWGMGDVGCHVTHNTLSSACSSLWPPCRSEHFMFWPQQHPSLL